MVGGHDPGCTKGERRGGRTRKSLGANAVAASRRNRRRRGGSGGVVVPGCWWWCHGGGAADSDAIAASRQGRRSGGGGGLPSQRRGEAAVVVVMAVVLLMPSWRHSEAVVVVVAVWRCRRGGVVVVAVVEVVASSCQRHGGGVADAIAASRRGRWRFGGAVAAGLSSSSCLEGCESELVVCVTKVLWDSWWDLVKISTHLVLYSYTSVNLVLMNLRGATVRRVWSYRFWKSRVRFPNLDEF